MLKDTLTKFQYPNSLIKEYKHWYVLLRPEQVTLGSLILISKENVTGFSDISEAGFAEYPSIIRAIEQSLTSLFSYDKINYLMLMMVDPEVHVHIIPRYAQDVRSEGREFKDYGWPALPDLSRKNELSVEGFDSLKQIMVSEFEV